MHVMPCTIGRSILRLFKFPWFDRRTPEWMLKTQAYETVETLVIMTTTVNNYNHNGADIGIDIDIVNGSSSRRRKN